MRNVDSHLLEDKMEEVVTHYINTHQPSEAVHVDTNGLALNVHDNAEGRVVTVMHPQGFTPQMCRQVSIGDQVVEGTWNEELIDPDGRLAALFAHLAHHTRGPHHTLPPHHKISTLRSDVDTSVILDAPMRLFNGQTLEQPSEAMVVQVPQLPPLPTLQDIKRCQDTDWFNNKKTTLKDGPILSEAERPVLELRSGAGAGAAASKQPSKKSLPHKKRISKKLKRNTGNTTPQQDIVVINYAEEGQQEEILPDSFVASVPHQELTEDTHHITHEVRPIFICQLCGEFYGEEQLKFYQHLKQHYEPHTIIIENPVSELAIDKMTNTCIVDNVATLPDSIVELSLENTVPKTMYQPIDKHILYTSSDKTITYTNNKVQYSMASMDKNETTTETEKADLYETLDKLDLYNCVKCNRVFKKQTEWEAHIKEAHSNSKLEDIAEFSEPEDLMEGIHVSVSAEEGGDYEHTLLPTLTVHNGHVTQEHVRHWYIRNGGCNSEQCNNESCCPPRHIPHDVPHDMSHDIHHVQEVHHQVHHDMSHDVQHEVQHDVQHEVQHDVQHEVQHDVQHEVQHDVSHDSPHESTHDSQHLKEEVFQRIFESDVVPENNFQENNIETTEIPQEPQTQDHPKPEPQIEEESGDGKKKTKKCICGECGRVFKHRNSLLYHMLSHSGRQQTCRDCGKSFYTLGALKVHKRVHNGDKPYKCTECGRDFRQWSDLKYHKMSIHSNQKHFKCEFCGKEFARKYSLNVHVRIHTGERNYKCEYCNKTFRASSYRLSHMRTHTGDKPYKCEECEKRFRVASDLRRHMVTHEKVRNRFEEQKTKGKDVKDKKTKNNDVKNDKTENTDSPEKKTHKPTIIKNAEKKTQPKTAKKNQAKKGGAPNVTIHQKIGEEVFKSNIEYTNNVEVFDTRHDSNYNNRFKEVDNVNQYNKVTYVYDHTPAIVYKDERLNNFAVLKPVRESDKLQFVDKSKAYAGPVSNSQVTLGDIRHLEREVTEVRGNLQGENENGFLESLTALYNIPAV